MEKILFDMLKHIVSSCVWKYICNSQKISLALARNIDSIFTIWHLSHSLFSFSLTFFGVFCRTLACIMTDIWKKLWWHWKRTQNSGKSWKKQMSLILRFLKNSVQFHEKLERVMVRKILQSPPPPFLVSF